MNHGCVSNYTSDDAIIAISSLLLECALKSHGRKEEKKWYVPLYDLSCGGLYLIRFYFFLAVPYVIQRISSYVMIDNIDYFSIPVLRCATMFKRINIPSNRNYCEHWLMETDWRRGDLWEGKLFQIISSSIHVQIRVKVKCCDQRKFERVRVLLNTSNFERWCMKLKQHQFQLFTWSGFFYIHLYCQFK